MPHSRTTKKSSRTKRSMSMNGGMGPPRVLSPDAPTNSSASPASSSSRSDGSPTRTGSSATTAPELGRGGFRWAKLGVALAAGILAGFCFPPFDLGPLIVVALGALLWTWRDARPSHAALYGFAFGIGCYGVVLEWVRYFGLVAIVPFVGAMAVATALVGLIVAGFARRGIASPLLTASAWVVLEALRGRAPLGGFAWADVGVALHDLSPARALASFGGVPLVSFVTVALAGFLARLRVQPARAPATRDRAGGIRCRRHARRQRARRRHAVRADRDRATPRRDAAG